MKYIKRVVLLLLAYYLTLSTAKKGMKIDRYEVCARGEKDPARIHTMTLDYVPGLGFVINLDADLYRDLNTDALVLEIKITRCSNKEALDSCEKMSPLKHTKICQILNVRNMGWDEIIDRVEPPLRCPFKKGHYVGRNLTFNPAVFQFFPLDGFYWKINGSLYENHDLLASLCFECQVIRA